MSHDRKKILAKIKALMAKTEDVGCTEAEAFAAMLKARELMDLYDLDEADLTFGGEEVRQERVQRWDRDGIRWTLCGYVARFCDCRIWGEGSDSASSKIVFLGLESDTTFARWLLDTLTAFIQRSAIHYLADVGAPVMGMTDLFGAPLNGASREEKRRGFVVGCTQRICERLNLMTAERQAKSASDGRSLVVVKNALVTDAFRKLNLQLRRSRGSGMTTSDGGAAAAGRAAGDRASFGRPVGGGRGEHLAIGRR